MHCPPVATTFPDLAFDEWKSFRAELPTETPFSTNYGNWLLQREAAAETGATLRPFVAMPVTYDGWREWCDERQAIKGMASVRDYANDLFEKKVRVLMASARERLPSSIIPSRYVLAITEEIGQDRANDLSHIAALEERPNSDPTVRTLVANARIFHEHALAVACAHAIAQGVEYVLWQKELRYAWV
jgi:hypothetical protein